MSKTTHYFIRPHSPLVFRSGRPYGDVGAADGNQADGSYGFPLPATAAGALRAAWVDAARHPVQAQDETLMKLHVQGGLRAVRLHGRTQIKLFAPAPADARFIGHRPGRLRMEALLPLALKAGQLCNLPHQLLPVAPASAAPTEDIDSRYWPVTSIQQWLQQQMGDAINTAETLGALPAAVRQHVVINPGTRAHEAQGYFQSVGLDFESASGEQGLLAWMSSAEPHVNTQLADGRAGRLGADGRTAAFEQVAASDVAGLKCPAHLAQHLDGLQPGDWFRLLLVTPACYLRNGWYPDAMKPAQAGQTQAWIEGPLVPLLNYGVDHQPAHQRRSTALATSARADLGGWKLRLRAVALAGAQPLAVANQRGADGSLAFTRRSLQRLVPAGTVYWLEIIEKGQRPLSELWMQSTCRDEFARDGFGLALPGLAEGACPVPAED